METKNYYIIANRDLPEKSGVSLLHWAGGPVGTQVQFFGDALTLEQVEVIRSTPGVKICNETDEEPS